MSPDSGIIVAFCVTLKRGSADSRVAVSDGVEIECTITVGSVELTGDVAKQRLKTSSGVEAAYGVVYKSSHSNPGIVRTSGIEQKGSCQPTAVFAAPVVRLKSAFCPSAVVKFG